MIYYTRISVYEVSPTEYIFCTLYFYDKVFTLKYVRLIIFYLDL